MTIQKIIIFISISSSNRYDTMSNQDVCEEYFKCAFKWLDKRKKAIEKEINISGWARSCFKFFPVCFKPKRSFIISDIQSKDIVALQDELVEIQAVMKRLKKFEAAVNDSFNQCICYK